MAPTRTISTTATTVISSVLKTACTRLPLARAVLKLSIWRYPGIFQRELVSICRFSATETRI